MSGPSSGEQLADVAVKILAGVMTLAGLLWAAAHANASLTGQQPPRASVFDGAWTLLQQPGDPAQAWGTPVQPVAYWLITAALLALVAVVAAGIWRLGKVRDPRRPRDPRRLPGLPTAREVAAHSGARALVRRAAVLRPSLAGHKRVRPDQVGYRIGRVGRHDVWVSVEDSITVLGPPRAGKSRHLIQPMIRDAPGAVVATSIVTDNITCTLAERRRRGPVAVFAPSLAGQFPAGIRWSPVTGCDDPNTAQLRATALTAGTSRGVENATFWRDKTVQALYPLLHAAAIAGRGTAEFDRWCSGPALAVEAVTILRDHPAAVPGWADKLDEIVSADPRTRDNMWAGIAQATRSLSNPDVLAACTPEPGEEFDPARFLAECGTLYIVGDDKGLDGPLVAALVEDIFATAKQIANRSPGNRCDPPLLMALDEVANIAYLPSLPTMTSAGGGRGITVLNVWQSRAQARDRWGVHAERAIWAASTVKIILGGVGDAQDLKDLTTLIGTRDERTTSINHNPDGTTATTTTWRDTLIIRPEQVATLANGEALVTRTGQRPTIISLIRRRRFIPKMARVGLYRRKSRPSDTGQGSSIQDWAHSDPGLVHGQHRAGVTEWSVT